MPVQAIDRHYFDPVDCPVAVVDVDGADAAGLPSHPQDLTEVEHDHDFNELVVVTGGRAMHHLGGYTVPVAAGDVYLLLSLIHI